MSHRNFTMELLLDWIPIVDPYLILRNFLSDLRLVSDFVKIMLGFCFKKHLDFSNNFWKKFEEKW